MSLKKQNSLKKKLDYEDVFCIACRCIYIRPVTMPCDHTLCLECFKNMVNITAYHCPTCRRRISNWLRKYKHDWDALVNEALWETVQQQYPVEVQKRLNNEDDGLEEIIVGQGFIRVETNEGEIKKEFDSMITDFKREEEKIELQNIKLARQLQEEEETQNLLYEKITHEDFKLASSMQENIKKEFELEQTFLEKDNELAKQLQDQMKLKFGQTNDTEHNKPFDSKNELTKKGPLDIIFSKLTDQNSKVQSMENSLPSCSHSSNTSSLFNSLSSSSSCIYPTISTDSSKISKRNSEENEILDDCTCGRLLEFNSDKPPCQFCTEQVILFDKLLQQKKDYFMAQDLKSKINLENIENFNMRKRSSPIQHGGRKKSIKLDKGQQTLIEVFQKCSNKND